MMILSELLQKIFDISCLGLLDQNFQSSGLNDEGICQMLDIDGNRCAVGHLLPVDFINNYNLADVNTENFLTAYLHENELTYDISEIDRKTIIKMLYALQTAHDEILYHKKKIEWVSDIVGTAKEFNLSLKNVANHPLISCVSYTIFSKESIKLMNGNRGKFSSMAGHSFLHSWWDSDDKNLPWNELYRQSMFAKKVTLSVDTTEELVNLYDMIDTQLKEYGLTIVEDAGLTVFKEPTIVCVGIGPIPSFLVPDAIKPHNMKVLI